MKLAIRTSSGPYGVGLFSEDGKLIADMQDDREDIRSMNIGDLFIKLIGRAGYGILDITEVLVDLGPGGLSSTRVGVSFANAFSFGQRTKLLGVSALDLQMHDARRHSDLPILSMRPAPGGNVFWSMYVETTKTAKGCSLSQEAIDQQARCHDRIAVVGPLKRLSLNDSDQKNVVTIGVDPTSLESFSLASKQFPKSNSAISLLEPIISAEGL